VIGGEPVDEQVVDDGSLRRRERGVLRLAVDQFIDVVGGDAIYEGDCFGTANVDLAHMRNVEEAGVSACAQVFFDGTGGILDWHVPAAEIDHAAAQLPVSVIEWGLF